jgi:hypothetical protein
MKLIASRIPLFAASAILLAAMIALVAIEPDLCDSACSSVAPAQTSAGASGPTPTLAPPQKMVVVQVEVDKPDLQVGWVESKQN